ncbi:MAG: NAD(P)-dependent oxidoreductase [Acidimicrobiales bacterium]
MTKVAVTSGLFAAMPDMAAALRQQHPEAKIIEGRPPKDEDELIAFLQGYEVVVAGTEPFTAKVVGALPDLKVIACCSAGLDHLDPAVLNARGIRVGWVAGVNKYAVSEMALCFMIDILRSITSNNVAVRAGSWPRVRGALLRGRTVGVHGCGNIGQEVVKLLQPFGCTVLASDRVAYPEFYQRYGVEAVSPEQLWARAEVLTVHLPRNRSTIGLYSAEVLDQLRPGAYVVNTSRGRIFDEVALYQRLADGRIAAAAFDVFATEPLANLDLVSLSNFVGTSHIGAGADEAWVAMAEAGIRGITEHFLPEPGIYPFD